MDRLEAMSLLVAVTDAGSLSAASRAVSVPLATLSRKISDLESHLGARLLIRTTRKLTLTDAGAVYVAATRRILEQVEEAERDVAGEFVTPKGELVLTAPILFGRMHVLPIVTDFLARFPDITVRLVLADRNVDLIEGHVDMAVRIGSLADSTMIATRVGSMRTVVCASPDLLARHGVPETPEDLLTLPCVGVETPLPSPGWRFKVDGTRRPQEVSVVPRLSVTTTEAAVEAAIRHAGATRVLHYQVAGPVAQGALRIVLEAFEPDPVPVHLLHVAHGQMPLKMRRFLDVAVPRLRETLARLGPLQA
jgi:DNA-binding transcriptional LysR family regulator